MKSCTDIVTDWVMGKCGRMPITEDEVNQYLDLINHCEEYQKALRIERMIGVDFMKKLGFRTPSEIKSNFNL